MVLTDAHALGATPIEPEDLRSLKPEHICHQGELNEWEANNIQAAEQWLARPRTKKDALDFGFVIGLHKRMFGDTWHWAGTIRQRETTIGVDPIRIQPLLRQALDNTRTQLEHAPAELDEIAARFHHRVVWIHPFPNGNGRHARLLTDVLLQQHRQPRFTWGGEALAAQGDARTRYLAALRAADDGDYRPLNAFVRS